MFSLFNDIDYQFELWFQHIEGEDFSCYMGDITTGTRISVYAIDDETDEPKAIHHMRDIIPNVCRYLLSYWREGHMLVLTNVTFLKLEDDGYYLETSNNGLCRMYRIARYGADLPPITLRRID